MRRFRFLLVLLFFTAIVPVATANSEVLKNELEDFLADNSIAGGVFWANTNGTIIDVAAGQADRTLKREMTPQTRFYIASSGKMMTAAAILSHVENGILKTEALVWPYIKNISNIDQLENADQVTIRQLLNHTSGLAEYLTDDFFVASLKRPSHAWSPAEAIEFAYGEPAKFAPATAYEYTNTNYVLLGHILAEIDGSLADSLKKHVFDKANMTSSSVGADATASHLAHGYDGFGADVSQLAWASTLGDGPVVATAADLGRFLRALFSDKSILGQDTLAKMLSGSTHGPDYGLGMGIDGDQWGTWYGHSGAYEGFESYERHYPERNTTLVLLINGNTNGDVRFLDVAADILFDSQPQ